MKRFQRCKNCKYWTPTQKNIGLCSKNKVGFVGLAAKVYVTICDLNLDWIKEVDNKSNLEFAEELMVEEDFICRNFSDNILQEWQKASLK